MREPERASTPGLKVAGTTTIELGAIMAHRALRQHAPCVNTAATFAHAARLRRCCDAITELLESRQMRSHGPFATP